MWTWLVENGLYRDILSMSIMVPIMRLMAVKPLVQLRKVIDEIRVEANEHRSLETVVKAAVRKK